MLWPDPQAYLFDIQQAGRRIQQFIAGLSFEDYTASTLVQSAVERTLGALAGRLVRDELERSRERRRAQLERQRLPVLSLFEPEAEAREGGRRLPGESPAATG